MELEKFSTADDIRELLTVRDRVEDLAEGQRETDPGTPKCEMRDLGEAFRVVLEVPGVPQESLEIALKGRELVIAGIRDVEENDGKLVFTERPTGPFHRTVQIPADVEAERIRAHLQQGLLVVTLPKA